MNRLALEHIIRAAGAIADDSEIIVFGSQAILGQFPNAPVELLRSIEADVVPLNNPDKADLIDGSIGELSPFHDTYGYYAHGVSLNTAVLPAGWESRLVEICNDNTRRIRGLCLEVHDLAVSKHIAGREKDLEFVTCLARHKLVNKDTLLQRVSVTAIDSQVRELVIERIKRLYSSGGVE